MKREQNTSLLIKSFYKVYNTFGFGFLEKVYLNALFLKLLSEGLVVQKQRQIIVFYNQMQVGEYYADLIVDDTVIIELKAHECLLEEHDKQLINFLRRQK